MNKQILLLLITMIIFPIMLSACGVKPSYVNPPSGQEKVAFPSKYPKNVSK